MLTDIALKHLKPTEKMYKVTDRDGMYAVVRPSRTLSFQLDYRMNGRRETVIFGKYGPVGLSLARAREMCIDAKRPIKEGRSPAIEKQRDKRRLLEAKSFGELGQKWLTAATMADSTRAMRRSIFERELLPKWRNRLLTEITPADLRAHCGSIVERGAPATAIHVRDIVKRIYGFAILHGEKIANPADDVGPSSIATFVPKDRSSRRLRSGSCPRSSRRWPCYRQSGSACASISKLWCARASFRTRYGTKSTSRTPSGRFRRSG